MWLILASALNLSPDELLSDTSLFNVPLPSPTLLVCCPCWRCCCSWCYPFAAKFSLLINFNALCHNNDIIIISFLIVLLSALAGDCVDLSPFYGHKERKKERKQQQQKKTTTNLRLIYKYFCSPPSLPLLLPVCIFFLLCISANYEQQNSKK